MKVFILAADANNYQNLVLEGERTLDVFRQFDGSTVGDPLKEIRVQVVPPEPGQLPLPKSDFPSVARHIPIFSVRAYKALSDLLDGQGQPFAISTGHEDYLLFNVTRVVDALDEESSEVKKFKSSGRIMDILTHSFHPKRLVGLTIFKIPQVSLMNVYVTDAFKERVQRSNLVGFSFSLVWTDEV
jgi:hypothetical protein